MSRWTGLTGRFSFQTVRSERTFREVSLRGARHPRWARGACTRLCGRVLSYSARRASGIARRCSIASFARGAAVHDATCAEEPGFALRVRVTSGVPLVAETPRRYFWASLTHDLVSSILAVSSRPTCNVRFCAARVSHLAGQARSLATAGVRLTAHTLHDAGAVGVGAGMPSRAYGAVTLSAHGVRTRIACLAGGLRLTFAHESCRARRALHPVRARCGHGARIGIRAIWARSESCGRAGVTDWANRARVLAAQRVRARSAGHLAGEQAGESSGSRCENWRRDAPDSPRRCRGTQTRPGTACKLSPRRPRPRPPRTPSAPRPRPRTGIQPGRGRRRPLRPARTSPADRRAERRSRAGSKTLRGTACTRWPRARSRSQLYTPRAAHSQLRIRNPRGRPRKRLGRPSC